jgi:glyoxylase-like metal-dependent hydrolase (beta-lactamase superfamily II)
MRSWAVGAVEVVRVDDPGHDLVLPQDDATVAALRRAPWLRTHFVTDDWSLRIGSSATVLRSGGRTVVVDPFLAFDDSDRIDARVAALRAAGGEPEAGDVVVNTHVDGNGVTVRAAGSPAFPPARYLVPRAELEALRAGTHGDLRGLPLVALWDDGTVEASDGSETVADGVRLEDAPGHNPGHHVVWIEDGGDAAVIVGHLFLHPAQIADPDSEIGDWDPEALARTRRRLLTRCVDTGATLIGPLFADPGAGTVVPDGDTWRLAAAA